VRSPCCLYVCVYHPLINLLMPEPIFMKLSNYIMAPEPISVAYYLNPSHQSVYLCVCVCIPPIVARRRLGWHVPAVTKMC
jgi:hypothetical protein